MIKLKYKKDPDAIDISKDNFKFICILLIWPLLHFIVFWVYVNFSTFYNSFFKFLGDGSKVFWGLEGYGRVFKDILANLSDSNINNYRATLNVGSLMLLSCLINMPIMLLFSYWMFKKVAGSKFFRIVLFAPSVVSTIILCLAFSSFVEAKGPFNMFLKAIGLGGDGTPGNTGIIPTEGWLNSPDTAWPTILVFSVIFGVSGYIIYFTSAMGRMPGELFESAALDGASEIRQFFSIVIPLIWPVLTTFTVSTLSGTFSWYMPSLLMTNGTNIHTTTIGLIIITNAKAGVPNGTICAMGVLVALIGGTLIFTVKHLMEKCFEGVQY